MNLSLGMGEGAEKKVMTPATFFVVVTTLTDNRLPQAGEKKRVLARDLIRVPLHTNNCSPTEFYYFFFRFDWRLLFYCSLAVISSKAADAVFFFLSSECSCWPPKGLLCQLGQFQLLHEPAKKGCINMNMCVILSRNTGSLTHRVPEKVCKGILHASFCLHLSVPVASWACKK